MSSGPCRRAIQPTIRAARDPTGAMAPFRGHSRYSFSVARTRAMRAFSLLTGSLLSSASLISKHRSIRDDVTTARTSATSVPGAFDTRYMRRATRSRDFARGGRSVRGSWPTRGAQSGARCQRRSALVLPRCQLDDALRLEWHSAASVCAHVRPSVCERSAVPTKATIRHGRAGGTLAASGSGACGASHMLAARPSNTRRSNRCYVEPSAFGSCIEAAEALHFPLRLSHLA